MDFINKNFTLLVPLSVNHHQCLFLDLFFLTLELFLSGKSLNMDLAMILEACESLCMLETLWKSCILCVFMLKEAYVPSVIILNSVLDSIDD